MNTAKLEAVTIEYIKVIGDINFTTVSMLRAEGQRLIAAGSKLEFDFSQVTHSDSSSLALLTAWYRYAKRHKKQLVLRHLPSNLVNIAKLSNLDTLFPLSH